MAFMTFEEHGTVTSRVIFDSMIDVTLRVPRITYRERVAGINLISV